MKTVRIPIKKYVPETDIDLEKEYAEHTKRARKKWPSKKATAKKTSRWYSARKIRSQF